MITTPSADWKALRAAYGALVKLFGDGWMAGQAERMADVFTSNGVLVPGPFDAPLKGRSAIAEYWKDIPLDQAEISFRYGEIYVAGPWFATEFRCTFRRRRTGKFVDVKGAIFCETSEGKIAEMRMYWQRVSAR